MSGDQIARLFYLGLLVVVLGGSLVVSQRRKLGSFLRNILLWGLIFIGIIVAKQLWDEITLGSTQQVTVGDKKLVATKQEDGHFHLELEINGVAVPFIVDTGASSIVLSKSAAHQIGIDFKTLHFVGNAQTANGTVKIAPVVLNQIQLGPFIDYRVTAVVNEGDMQKSLLGMDYLSRFPSLEIQKNKLILSR